MNDNKSGDGDKRSVHTDALETLGNIIAENEKRDAIHIAVEPIRVKEIFRPGDHIGVDGTHANPVGIVDPFLKTLVQPGEMCWLLIYPREIKSLRHVWEHPAFSPSAGGSIPIDAQTLAPTTPEGCFGQACPSSSSL